LGAHAAAVAKIADQRTFEKAIKEVIIGTENRASVDLTIADEMPTSGD
jgi:hypothetical protein